MPVPSCAICVNSTETCTCQVETVSGNGGKRFIRWGVVSIRWYDQQKHNEGVKYSRYIYIYRLNLIFMILFTPDIRSNFFLICQLGMTLAHDYIARLSEARRDAKPSSEKKDTKRCPWKPFKGWICFHLVVLWWFLSFSYVLPCFSPFLRK